MHKKDWEQRLSLYDQLVDRCTGFERKGKNMVYTSANGYMFSQLNKEGALGIRLSKDKAAEFMADYDSGPFLSYGAIMKDYVKVPDALLNDPDTLQPYLQAGFEYVMDLPPK